MSESHTADVLAVISQAEGWLNRLSRGNRLFEVDDLRQVFAEGVVRELPRTQWGPEAPAPPHAHLYQYGMHRVYHYIRKQANRHLNSYCLCGWSGPYHRHCPVCNAELTGIARYEDVTDQPFTHTVDFDACFVYDHRLYTKLSPAEKQVLWLIINQGPSGPGFWRDIATILNVSTTRVMQLRARIIRKLELEG